MQLSFIQGTCASVDFSIWGGVSEAPPYHIKGTTVFYVQLSLFEVWKAQKETGDIVLVLVSIQGQWLGGTGGKEGLGGLRPAGLVIIPKGWSQAIPRRQYPKVVGARRGLGLSTKEVQVSIRSEWCPIAWDPLWILVTSCLPLEEH